MLIEFSLTCIFHHAFGKHFKFIVFTFLENALNLGSFTRAPVSQLKLQAEFFENVFLPSAESGREKYEENAIRKYEDHLEH